VSKYIQECTTDIILNHTDLKLISSFAIEILCGIDGNVMTLNTGKRLNINLTVIFS